jgi:hypothetical protein
MVKNFVVKEIVLPLMSGSLSSVPIAVPTSEVLSTNTSNSPENEQKNPITTN